MRHLPAMIIYGLALLFVVSCTTLTSSSELVPGSTEFPTGRFVYEDYERRAWAVQFNEDGTWAYFAGDMEVPAVSGTYTVDGNLYTEASSDFEECPFPATYRWDFDGQRLSFALHGEDNCSHRRVSYDGRTYIKSE